MCKEDNLYSKHVQWLINCHFEWETFSYIESVWFWGWKTQLKRFIFRNVEKGKLWGGFHVDFSCKSFMADLFSSEEFSSLLLERMAAVLFGKTPVLPLPGVSSPCFWLFNLLEQTTQLWALTSGPFNWRFLGFLIWAYRKHFLGLQAFSWLLQIPSMQADLLHYWQRVPYNIVNICALH